MLRTHESAAKHDDSISSDIDDLSINMQLTPEDEPLLMQDEQDKDKQKKTDKVEKAATVSPNATKVLFLDGIRGLSAILVIAQHSGEYLVDLYTGSIAVDTFFVLSSFLLTWIFMKKSFRMLNQGAGIRTWVFALADYFSRRFFRVYPLFAITCVVVWFMDDETRKQYFLTKRQAKVYDLFKTLTFEFDYRYFVLWTLPLEIAYYFIIPVLVSVTLLLRKWWWVIYIPAYVLVVFEGCVKIRRDHQELLPHLPTFVAGSMAAVIFFKLDTWIKANKFQYRFIHKLILRTIEFSAFALFLSLVFGGLFFIWVHENPVEQVWGAPFISVPLSIVIVCEMLLPSPLSSMLEWSFLRYWGKISFSAYLLHGFVIYNDRVKSQPNYYCRLFSRFGLVCMLATTSYHLIEYPSQLLAQRITKALNEQEIKGSGGLTAFLGKWANPSKVLADGLAAVQEARASGEWMQMLGLKKLT